jgi:hypothetical protein
LIYDDDDDENDAGDDDNDDDYSIFAAVSVEFELWLS